MIMNFKEKTAIVTGGSRGIGRAICDFLRRLGCNVIATVTTVNKKGFPAKRRWRYLQLDLLDPKSVRSFIKTIKKLDHIDVLINNAGINIIEPIDKLKRDNWDKILQVNLTGPMLLTKEVSSIMKKKKKGKILNVSSIWGVISKEKRDAYCASKTGLIGLTRAMALDLAPYNILVNALCPGFTMTELTESTLSKSEIDCLANQIPLGRLADVEEMARTAVFMCSDLNTYITGQTIVVDGGFTIR